jgi:hypothetical protein
MATVAIKGKSSSNKSLISNLSKHTFLMAKQSKKKVRTKGSSSPKFVSSDEEIPCNDDDLASSDDDKSLPNEFCKNPNAMTKGLMKQVRVGVTPQNSEFWNVTKIH